MSELYASGKTGDFMQYSRNPYHTVSHMKLQVHTKILAGDYPYYAYIALVLTDRQTVPNQLAPVEDMTYLLTRCLATAVTRARFTTNLLNAIGT